MMPGSFTEKHWPRAGPCMSEGRGSPQAWFKLAFADLRLVESHAHDIEQGHNVMWHCQQAVEKAIKGFLIARGERFRFTHDLTELSEPEIVDSLIGRDREALATLATRAIECRYRATTKPWTRRMLQQPSPSPGVVCKCCRYLSQDGDAAGDSPEPSRCHGGKVPPPH
jgi:HEPN domain-containing protein